MTTSHTTDAPASNPAWSIGGATVAAVMTWIGARAADVDMEVTSGGDTMEVGLALVAVAALGASLAGWGLLAGLRRRTDSARRVWSIIATAVLVLSLPGPLLSDASTGTRISLALMHVAVGAVLIPGLRSASTAEPVNSRNERTDRRGLAGTPQ